MSETIQVTDALIATLNSLELAGSTPYTAERLLRPLHDLTELNALKVVVMPAQRIRTQITRGKFRRQYRIDAAVQKKFGTGTAEPDPDPLFDLAEQLADALLSVRPASLVSAICTQVEQPFLFVPEHWERRLFTSVIAYTLVIGP